MNLLRSPVLAGARQVVSAVTINNDLLISVREVACLLQPGNRQRASGVRTCKANPKLNKMPPGRWRCRVHFKEDSVSAGALERPGYHRSSTIDHLARSKNGFQLRRKTPSHDQIAIRIRYFLLLELWLRLRWATSFCGSRCGSCLSRFGTFIIITIIININTNIVFSNFCYLWAQAMPFGCFENLVVRQPTGGRETARGGL